jgi:phosphoribosylglycinamide formyltransferase-1
MSCLSGQFSVGFCVSGRGQLARAAIEHAGDLGILPKLMILDEPAAMDLEPFCESHNVTALRLTRKPREHFDVSLYNACAEADLNLLVLTFDRIIRPPLIKLYNEKIINVHPSILPAYVGANALERSCYSGVRFGGATIHEVTEGLDEGPIICQCALALNRDESPVDFGKRLYPYLKAMYLQTIMWYAAGLVFKDDKGKIWIRDANYGSHPVSPQIDEHIENICFL